jgi:antirestriction protein ArdC
MSLNVYEIITDRIIKSLEGGIVPWRKSWKSVAPRNLISKKPYRGVNVFLLGTAPYASPYWLTFRQAKGKGGSVRKGERGTPVIFWKVFDDDGEKFSRPPILRYYTVFNAEQCDGIEVPKSEDDGESLTFEPIEACEQIVRGYATCPPIEHGGDKASYNPNFDRINMPPREHFSSEEEYYATLFHEMAHSSGHARRLNRDGITNIGSFASHSYSLEELIAEMTSSFLCGESGILNLTIENSAAYIGSWVKRLQSNPKWLVQAGGQASKASDYILGRDKVVEQEGEETA